MSEVIDNVRNYNRKRLRSYEEPIAGCDDYVIDIVSVGIAGQLEIRGRSECKHAGGLINSELGGMARPLSNT
jgi:hypothetical protein